MRADQLRQRQRTHFHSKDGIRVASAGDPSGRLRRILRVGRARWKDLKRLLGLACLVSGAVAANGAVPAIASFSPASGPIGTSVTITGTDFSPEPSNNLVFFGGVRAAVVSASSDLLGVAVPAGAVLAPITVAVGGRTATSAGFFNPTFPGSFNVTFAPKTTFAVGGSPRYVAVGDFNGDGRPDLATANVAGSVSVLFSTGSGGLTGRVDLAAGIQPISLAVADFNGDGISDLADCEGGTFDSLVLACLGSRSGTFSAFKTCTVGTYPSSIVAADFNQDGRMDLASADAWSDTISVLLGAGDGGFGARMIVPTAKAPLAVTAGDWNRDGHIDLASGNDITTGSTDSVSIVLGDGTGGFIPQTNISIGGFPREIVTGDFNRDGILDIATADCDGSVSVLLGNNDGSFSVSSIPAGPCPHGLAVGDFNGDGKADLTVANRTGDSVSVFLGDGQGGFGRRTDLAFAANSAIYSVAVGDFNLDGKPDIVGANAGDDTIAVFLNTTTPPLPMYPLLATTAGGGVVFPDPLLAGYTSNTLVTVIAKAASGWQLLDWLGDAAGGNASVECNITRPMCLEAVFGTRLFTSTDGDGAVIATPSCEFHPYGSSVRIVAVPVAGSYFAGWSGGAGGDINPRSMPVLNANSTITASFAPLSAGQCALTVISDGLGRVSVTPRANRYANGQNVTVTATPDRGQQFLGWSGDASGASNPLVLTMNRSTVMTAQFTRRPSLALPPCFGAVNTEAVHLVLTGEAGTTNRIEFSDDLRAWGSLATVTNRWGMMQHTDRTATNTAQRFYRARAI
jgi:hypothetical protein